MHRPFVILKDQPSGLRIASVCNGDKGMIDVVFEGSEIEYHYASRNVTVLTASEEYSVAERYIELKRKIPLLMAQLDKVFTIQERLAKLKQ